MVDLVYTDQAGCKLEHVVTQGDHHELSILRPLLNIASNDGNLESNVSYPSWNVHGVRATYISEVQCRVNLVHDVKGRGLVVVERKH